MSLRNQVHAFSSRTSNVATHRLFCEVLRIALHPLSCVCCCDCSTLPPLSDVSTTVTAARPCRPCLCVIAVAEGRHRHRSHRCHRGAHFPRRRRHVESESEHAHTRQLLRRTPCANILVHGGPPRRVFALQLRLRPSQRPVRHSDTRRLSGTRFLTFSTVMFVGVQFCYRLALLPPDVP